MRDRVDSCVSFLVTGDYCPVNRTDILSQEKSFNELFNDFLPVVRQVDFAITNLEAPVTERGTPIQKTGPSLRVPPHTLDTLVYGGFNMVTLANNHILDYGKEGLVSTISQLEDRNILYVGAGDARGEFRAVRYLDIKGKRIAVVNFAENEFIQLSQADVGANPLDLVENFYQIQTAKRSADYVLVICHGGHEMYQYPSPRMKRTFRFFADVGADAVINHHPHCVSGYEVYKGVPIFYSLGNFIFDNKRMDQSLWGTGMAVILRLGERVSFEVVPFRQFDQVGVRLLSDLEREQFDELIASLNLAINDDAELKEKFNAFVASSSRLYNGFLEPFSSRVMAALRRRFVIPSVLGRRKKLLYSNLIRCEAHRDVLLQLLENETRNPFQ